MKLGGFVKNRRMFILVIPAKAGIQDYQSPENLLDPGFHRGDNFLPIHKFEKLTRNIIGASNKVYKKINKTFLLPKAD
jgi:hypothetical protein